MPDRARLEANLSHSRGNNQSYRKGTGLSLRTGFPMATGLEKMTARGSVEGCCSNLARAETLAE
jgi:hypothetical protein